jgi:hypothetical protein
MVSHTTKTFFQKLKLYCYIQQWMSIDDKNLVSICIALQEVSALRQFIIKKMYTHRNRRENKWRTEWKEIEKKIPNENLILYWSNLAEKKKMYCEVSERERKKEKKRYSRGKINEGGACRLIRNDVSVNRHINFQVYNFFPFFLNIRYVFILCVRTMSFNLRDRRRCLCRWSMNRKEQSKRNEEMCCRRKKCEKKRGTTIGKKLRRKSIWEWVIRKHKYWMFRVCELPFMHSIWNFIRLCQSWRIYGTFLCIQFMAHKKSESKMKEFSLIVQQNLIENFP